jgi:hypothetical protein
MTSTIGFGFPGGVVDPPNLTSDPETGLGRWTDVDVRAVVAYLRTVPPVRQAIPRPVPAGQRAPSPYLTVVEPR